MRAAFWLAVACSVGWHLRGLLDYIADRVGDTHAPVYRLDTPRRIS